MTRLHVEAEGTAAAGADHVWDLVSDATTYAEWGPWTGSGYERPGDGAERGPGAVRWMRYGRTTTVEQLLEVEEGRRLVYTVLRGIPVRNYRAEVVLTPAGPGTHIHWSATWDRTLAGRIVQRKLRQIYPHVVADLVTAADRRAARS